MKDEEGLIDSEDEERRDAMKLNDMTSDALGTIYLKVVNNMSFSDFATYTVELSVSKHGTPEVKEAKMTEVNNLPDSGVF